LAKAAADRASEFDIRSAIDRQQAVYGTGERPSTRP
jgi:hypothetical protein